MAKQIVILTLFCLSCYYASAQNPSTLKGSLTISGPVNDSYTKEWVEFTTADTIILKGILYMPKNNPEAIVIALDHPILGMMNFLENDTLLFNFDLMIRMFDKGIGYFMFSNRASTPSLRAAIFSAKTLDAETVSSLKKSYNLSRSSTLQTYADDTDAAVTYLKSRKDTKGLKVGLFGVSTAGCSVSVTAARNQDIDFIMALSTLFTNGIIWHKYASRYSAMNSLADFVAREEMRKLLKDPFTYNGVQYKNTPSIFSECYFKSLDTIDTQIVRYSNLDTIVRVAGEIMSSLLKAENFLPDKKFGAGNKSLNEAGLTPEQYIDDHFARSFYSPFSIEMIKWDPLLYYPKINIPTLILFGDKDKTLDILPTIQAAQSLAKGFNKSNFKIVVLENCEHSLANFNEVEVAKKSGKKTLIRMSESAVQTIINWLDNAVF